MFIRAALSQMPARSSIGAVSRIVTLPIPARRSANASAQPVWPPRTIATLWSIPGRSGTQLAGSGPIMRRAVRAQASGSFGWLTMALPFLFHQSRLKMSHLLSGRTPRSGSNESNRAVAARQSAYRRPCCSLPTKTDRRAAYLVVTSDAASPNAAARPDRCQPSKG